MQSKKLVSLFCVFTLLMTMMLAGVGPMAFANTTFGVKSWTADYNGGASGVDEVRLILTRPSNTVAGDFLLAQVTFSKGSDVTSFDVPAGWTQVIRTNRIDDIGQAIFYKYAGANEPATYTWQFRKTNSELEDVHGTGGILNLTGVSTTNPVIASGGNVGDGGTLSAPSVNGQNGAMLFAFYGYKKQVNLSEPSGMTKQYQVQNRNDSGPTSMAAAQLLTSSNATGARNSTYTPSDQSDKWVAQQVVIRPASGSTGGPPATTPPTTPPGQQSRPITVYIDGNLLVMEVSPFIRNGRTMVPMRALFEALGADVFWDPVERTVVATRSGKNILLPVNSNAPRVNGLVVPIDVPAEIINSRTFVPLRFVSEALGESVTYDESTGVITIIRVRQ